MLVLKLGESTISVPCERNFGDVQTEGRFYIRRLTTIFDSRA